MFSCDLEKKHVFCWMIIPLRIWLIWFMTMVRLVTSEFFHFDMFFFKDPRECHTPKVTNDKK